MTDYDKPPPSTLHDLDWIEANKLRRAYKDGGDDAVEKAWEDLLEKDVLQFARVARAYAPDSLPQRIKEALTMRGYTFQELIELANKKQLSAADGRPAAPRN